MGIMGSGQITIVDLSEFVNMVSGNPIIITDALSTALGDLTIYGKCILNENENKIEYPGCDNNGDIKIYTTSNNFIYGNSEDRKINNNTLRLARVFPNINYYIEQENIEDFPLTSYQIKLDNNIILEYPSLEPMISSFTPENETDLLIDEIVFSSFDGGEQEGEQEVDPLSDLEIPGLKLTYYNFKDLPISDIKKTVIALSTFMEEEQEEEEQEEEEQEEEEQENNKNKRNIFSPPGLFGINVSEGHESNYTDKEGNNWLCDTINKSEGVYTKRLRMLVFSNEDVSSSDDIISSENNYYYNDDSFLASGDIISNQPNNLQNLRINENGYIEWEANSLSYPLIFVAPLKTPIVTQLLQEQIDSLNLLATYENISTIYNINKADMLISYIKPSYSGNYLNTVNNYINYNVAALNNMIETTEDQLNINISANNELIINNTGQIQALNGELTGLSETINTWFTFDENGLSIAKKDSIWSTAVKEDGFYIYNSEIYNSQENPVGRFYQEQLEVHNLKMVLYNDNTTDNITMRATSTGGMIWV